MVLFPPPFYFFFISQTSYRTFKIISSYELARPIMGTIFLVIIIISYIITVKYICGYSKYTCDILSFYTSSESSGIAMIMISLVEMKEAGMAGRGFKVLQTQYREICCGENMFIHYRTLLLGGEGNISCTSLRCCHVGVKRS